MQDNEVDMEEAEALVSSRGSKLVWIGREPLEYIAGLLGMDPSTMLWLPPERIIGADEPSMKGMSGMVFVCYHGNSSLRVARFLASKGIRAYSLRGGITAIVGEIF